MRIGNCFRISAMPNKNMNFHDFLLVSRFSRINLTKNEIAKLLKFYPVDFLVLHINLPLFCLCSNSKSKYEFLKLWSFWIWWSKAWWRTKFHNLWHFIEKINLSCKFVCFTYELGIILFIYQFQKKIHFFLVLKLFDQNQFDKNRVIQIFL